MQLGKLPAGGLALAALLATSPGVLADPAGAKDAKKTAPAAKPATKETPVSEQVHSTPSGLQYVDLSEGTGALPERGKNVSVHYTGWLKNGKKFDSSVDRGRPFEFRLGAGQVIKGWDEGVATMKIGGKRKLIIPPELGYGDQDVGGGLIPARSTLIFEVELLGEHDA